MAATADTRSAPDRISVQLVILDLHHPTDVAAGAVLGGLLAMASLELGQLLQFDARPPAWRSAHGAGLPNLSHAISAHVTTTSVRLTNTAADPRSLARPESSW